MAKRLTPGALASMVLALLFAGLSPPNWVRTALLVGAAALALFLIYLLATARRERQRAGELANLLERVAVVGDEVVALRRGPTFAAWCDHSEGLLAAAIGEGAAANAIRPSVALQAGAAPPTFDPMVVASGAPYGGEIVSNVRSVAAHMGDIPLVRGFKPSAWSPFDRTSWEQEHARPIAWEPNNGAPCPWCGGRIYPSVSCDKCGAKAAGDLAFK